jgi:lipopolysaccharide/colanic/teichoic acid biosynthesis glycosyltransferase
MTFFERQELDKQPLFKWENDAKIIEIGKCLRSTCLDELPQSLIVLIGSPRLVGSRPRALAKVALDVTTAQHRPLVKPGITGLWKISGRSDLSQHEAVRLDLYYFENWSLTVLLVILLLTRKNVFGRVGAF